MLSEFAANYILETGPLTDIALYLSAHTADPGTTGASEVAGGAPAYARLDVSAGWITPVVDGELVLDVMGTGPYEFDVPAGTVRWLAIWDALTVGNYVGKIDVIDEVFAGQGIYTVNSVILPVTLAA